MQDRCFCVDLPLFHWQQPPLLTKAKAKLYVPRPGEIQKQKVLSLSFSYYNGQWTNEILQNVTNSLPSQPPMYLIVIGDYCLFTHLALHQAAASAEAEAVI